MKEQQTFKHKTPIQIRFNDIDGQQHVNNAIYQSYFDIGREGYFSEIHGQPYQTGGRSVVIAAVNTDFMKPVFRHDNIIVETKVISIGNKSLRMLQQISGASENKIYASCITIFSGFDYDKQESIEIPPKIAAAIESYENRKFDREEQGQQEV